MKKTIKAITVLLVFVAISIDASAQTDPRVKVVVIPMGSDSSLTSGFCPPAKGNNIVGGPAALHNYCWYLSATQQTCDTVCSDVGGTNLAVQAEDEWSDEACIASPTNSGPSDADVTTWFFNHGDPGNWGQAAGAGTGGHTLGFGWPSSGGYFGKCSTGTTTNMGTYPGDPATRSINIVCPCFGFSVP